MASNTQSKLPPGPELIERINAVAADLCDQSDGYGDRVELMPALMRFVHRNVPSVEPDSLGNIYIEHALFRYGLSGENCYDVLSDHFSEQQIRDLVDALELFAKRADLCWVCEKTTVTSTVPAEDEAGQSVIEKLPEEPEEINLCDPCEERVSEEGWEPDDSGRPGEKSCRRRRW
jgi:hypothetical protein